MKYLITIAFFSAVFTESSKSQSCNDLPLPFTSFAKAIKEIRNAEFVFTDQVQEGSGSWIISAEFFSCDDNFGYLVFTDDKGYEYIQKECPKSCGCSLKVLILKAAFMM